MASRDHCIPILSLVIVLLCFPKLTSATTARMLSHVTVNTSPDLEYHFGDVLSGDITVNILWYGNFTAEQQCIINDFFQSVSSDIPAPPSVASWWLTTDLYSGTKHIELGNKRIIDSQYSLGKTLAVKDLEQLAIQVAAESVNSINFIFTSYDVEVESFCVDRCGGHGTIMGQKSRLVYAWVGNPIDQCPGQCAWPFAIPPMGPKTQPRQPPNGDVGIDGMIINIATILAGAVTNPYEQGYYQGSPKAPLEAVSACTGIFGPKAFPGSPGILEVNPTTGGSYNVKGINGREYLLPAMWDPQMKSCKVPAAAPPASN